MVLVANILTLIISISILIKIRKCKMNSVFICLLIFDIAYVMPILAQIFLGVPYISYYGFKMALSNVETCIIYDIFVIIVQLIYYQYIKNKNNVEEKTKNGLLEIVEANRNKMGEYKWLVTLSNVLMLVPLLAWIFAPDPFIYFKGLGVFTMNNVETTVSDYNYFASIIKYSNLIGVAAIIVSKFIDINDSKKLKACRGITLAIITILNGKRTLFTLTFLALLAIDLLSNKKGKEKIIRSLFTSVIVLGYFVAYAYISGKSEYNSDWYSVISEYFFRGNTAKVAIYSILHPDKLKILDYPAQSMIYNLLFFIPRSIWPSKPFQYPMYFTSGVYNFDELKTVGWYFQTGLYGEMISNFGLLGIVLAPLFIRWIGKISDNSKNLITTFLGIIFCAFIQVFEYSDMFKVLFLIWIALVIIEKIMQKKNKKISILVEYIKNPKFILLKLDLLNIIKLKDRKFLELNFEKTLKEKLHLENPQTFNQKLQWLKLYDRNSKYTEMVDKYEAKKYVSNIIGEEYIIPTLGIYEKFEDINFEDLPEQFVLKCTHDSGGLVICKNKKEFNQEEAKKKINKCLKKNFYYVFREWPYKNVKPRIIAEKYMMDEKQTEELIDYKFFCFNGIPKFLYVSEGLSNHATAKISFANMNYEKEPFYRNDYNQFEELPEKPINFEKMKELAQKLAKDIPFLRVDFYEIDSKIYFSELTFFPNAGYIPFYPEKYDKVLGDMLELPKNKIGEKNAK